MARLRSPRKTLRLEVLESRLLLRVDAFPLPPAQTAPEGLTVLPGDVVRVNYTARVEGQLVLGRLCSDLCGGPTYFFEDPPLGISITPSKDARIVVNSNLPEGNDVFLGGTGLGLVGLMTPMRDFTAFDTQPGCGKAVSAVQGLTYAFGGVWYVDRGCNALGVLLPSTGELYTFPLDNPAGNPLDITASASGTLWITEPGTQTLAAVAFDKFGATVAHFPACDDQGLCVTPDRVVEGPDGHIWFSAPSALGQDFIGRITSDGLVRLYPIPESPLEPSLIRGVVAGPDGVWFADYLGHRLGRVNVEGVVDSLINLLDDEGRFYFPDSLARGPFEDFWFTLPDRNALGRYVPDVAPGPGNPPASGPSWLDTFLAEQLTGPRRRFPVW